MSAAGLEASTRALCDRETRYHCVRILEDPRRPAGRLLMLNVLGHSYVDLDDPTHLEFRYVKVLADVAETVRPGAPLSVLHLGGGGFTLPRYLAITRPGSRHLVLEVDPGLVELARQRLGLVTGPNLAVRVGDARLLLPDVAGGSYDLVVGDVFGDRAVPWHLTTVEFVHEVKRVLRPDGVYVLNLVDYSPLRFARAEAATLGRVFRHVAVVVPPLPPAGGGGNFILAASDRPFDRAALVGRIAARDGDEEVSVDAAATDFAAGGRLLTDDYAPVDQWLARSRPPRSFPN